MFVGHSTVSLGSKRVVMSDNLTLQTNASKPKVNRKLEIWLWRFITYFLILGFLVSCAYIETILIPQAIEANQKIAEYGEVSSAQVADVVATHRNVRNSSWILAFVCFAMLPPGFWALSLATKEKYLYCWLIIGLCLSIFFLTAAMFKPF